MSTAERGSGRGERKGSGGGERRGSGGGGSGGDRERKDGLIDKLVKIRRCACVVKGGRRFSFTAMVVVGNGKGKVGVG